MRRSRVSSAGLSSSVCRSSMTSRARRPPQVSRAWAAASTESQRSGIGPSAAVNADHKWLSSVTVFASQLSARYQATGTLAAAAKPASSVLLPEPAGATTRPTRYCQIRSRRPSTRSRARECTWGISTLADTTAVDPSLTQVLPSGPVVSSPRRLRRRAAYANPYRPAVYVESPRLLRHTTRRFRIVNMVVANSPVAGSAPSSVRVQHVVDRCLKTCWTPTERRCRDGIGALCGRRGAHRETQPDRNRHGPRHLPELAVRADRPS